MNHTLPLIECNFSVTLYTSLFVYLTALFWTRVFKLLKIPALRNILVIVSPHSALHLVSPGHIEVTVSLNKYQISPSNSPETSIQHTHAMDSF